jgi:hypothetical protein
VATERSDLFLAEHGVPNEGKISNFLINLKRQADRYGHCSAADLPRCWAFIYADLVTATAGMTLWIPMVCIQLTPSGLFVRVR